MRWSPKGRTDHAPSVLSLLPPMSHTDGWGRRDTERRPNPRERWPGRTTPEKPVSDRFLGRSAFPDDEPADEPSRPEELDPKRSTERILRSPVESIRGRDRFPVEIPRPASHALPFGKRVPSLHGLDPWGSCLHTSTFWRGTKIDAMQREYAWKIRSALTSRDFLYCHVVRPTSRGKDARQIPKTSTLSRLFRAVDQGSLSFRS